MKKYLVVALVSVVIITGIIAGVVLLNTDEQGHQHSFGEWETISEPTCNSVGSQKRFCSCGEFEEQELSMLSHSEAEAIRENEIKATCTKDGSYESVVYCELCNTQISRETAVSAALGHTMGGFVSDNNATCTENGTKSKSCSNEGCDYVESVVDDNSALGHEYSVFVCEHTAATCSENRIDTYKCVRCELETNIIIADSAKGHRPSELEYEDEYCGDVRLASVYCGDCGEFIGIYGHNYVQSIIAATCDKAGSITYVCSVCNDTYSTAIQPHGHLHSGLVTVQASTCKDAGVAEDHCEICDILLGTTSLELEEHYYVSSVEGNTITYTCEVCEDSYTVVSEEKVICVNFNTQGGTNCTSVYVAYGDKAILPNTTKDGYDFVGWYFDAEGTDEYIEENLYEDVTLYAIWTENSIEYSDDNNIEQNVSQDWTFKVISSVYNTEDVIEKYVSVVDVQNNEVEIRIVKLSDGVFEISSENYKEGNIYFARVSDEVYFEETKEKELWFTIKGENYSNIILADGVKYLSTADIYGVTEIDGTYYLITKISELNADDNIAIYEGDRSNVSTILRIVSKDTVDGFYYYGFTISDYEEVIKEFVINESTEVDFSTFVPNEGLEDEIATAFLESPLHERLMLAANELSREMKMSFKLDDIKVTVTPKGGKLCLQIEYILSYENNVNVVFVMKDTIGVGTTVYFNDLAHYAAIINTTHDFNIQIYGCYKVEADDDDSIWADLNETITGKDFKSLKPSEMAKKFKRYYETVGTNSRLDDQPKDFSKFYALGTWRTPGTVNVYLTIGVDLDFEMMGNIGFDMSFTVKHSVGIKDWGIVNNFSTKFNSATLFGWVKAETAFMPKLEVGISVYGFTIYGDLAIGPYLELGGAGIVTGNLSSWNASKVNFYLEIGIKFTAGVGAKYQCKIWLPIIGNIRITLFDLHFNIIDETLVDKTWGDKEIALSFAQTSESFDVQTNCSDTYTFDLNTIDQILVFQDFEDMHTFQKEVDVKYSIVEISGKKSWAKIQKDSLVLSKNITSDFTIKIKVAYGQDVFKFVILNINVAHGENGHIAYVAPTCTTMGQNAYTYCKGCGGVTSGNAEKIEMLPHNNTLEEVCVEALRSNASCEMSATYWYSCVDCGTVVEDTFFSHGESLGHIWDDELSFDQNNHFNICLRVGCESKKDVVAHSHCIQMPTVEYIAENATCTEQAKYYHACDECGHAGGELFSYGELAPHQYADEYTCHDRKCINCEHIEIATTPHIFSDWVEVDPGICGGPVYNARVCYDCGYYEDDLQGDEIHPHNYVSGETYPATCTDDGIRCWIYCSKCEFVLAKEIIPALNHQLGQYISDEEGHYQECTRPGCNYCTEVESHTSVKDDAVSSTCLNTGLTEGSHCGICKYIIVAQQITSALGHDLEYFEAQEPTYTSVGWDAYEKCSRCDYSTYNEIPKLTHDMTHYAAVDATCTTDGNVEYWHCSECNKNYDSAIGTNVIDNVVLPKLGHDMKHIDYLAAMCTDDGHTEYEECSRCDYKVGYEKIDALTHDEQHHDGQPATCTEAGWEDYVTCSRCDYSTYKVIAAKGHSYTNYVSNNNATCEADGTKTASCDRDCGATDTKADVGSKLGHNYGDWYETEAATCTETGTKRRDCNRCDHYETGTVDKLDHDEQHHDGQPATCTEAGWEDYVTCSRCDYSTYTVISAKGHSYTNYVSNNNATCEADGTKTASCDRDCGATDTKADVGSKLGHNYGDWYETEAATCTETGTKRRDCNRCDHYETGTVDKLDHDEQHHDGQPATCTEAGWEDYVTCSRCDYSTYKVIAAKGHSYTNYVSNNNATCEADGTKTASCDRDCGATDTKADVGSKLGHNYGDWYETEAATCTETGTKRRDCNRCDHYETGTVDKLDHDEQHHDGQSATCTEAGWEDYVTCSRCDYTTYKVIAAKGHSFTNYVSNNDATCETDGTKTASCDRDCGATDTKADVGSKLGHNYGDWYETEAATCTETGTKRRDCSRCDHYETGVIEALDHSLSSWTQTQAPSCTVEGEKERHCIRTNCLYSETEPVEAIGHSFSTATCASPEMCGRCDAIGKPALGHSPSEEWSFDSNIHYHRCENAGCTEFFDVSAHILVTKTTTETVTDGYVVVVIDDCDTCDFVTELGRTIQHVHNDHEVLDGYEPTCTESGLTYGVKCSTCGEILLAQETKEALGHLFVDGECQRCGEIEYSQGFEYTLSDDGTYYILSDMGACTDTEIRIPAHYLDKPIEVIGIGAFANQSTIKTITFGDNIRQVEFGAFDGCSSLESVYLTNALTNIPDGIFLYCENLKSVYFEGTLEDWCSISVDIMFVVGGGSAEANSDIYGILYNVEKFFINGSLVKNVVLPESIGSVESKWFRGYLGLESVTWTSDYAYVGYYAFEGCINLRHLVLGDNVTHFEASALDGCEQFSFYEYNNGYYIGSKNNPYAVLYSIKSKEATTFALNPNTVVIATKAFDDYSALVSLDLGDSLIGIEANAFADCNSLKTVTIAKTVETIGYNAFSGCSIENVYYDGTVEEWNEIEFVYSASFGGTAPMYSDACNPARYAQNFYIQGVLLSRLVVKEGTTNIDDYEDSLYSGINEIVIPQSMAAIDNSVWARLEQLDKVFYCGTETEWQEICSYAFDGSTIDALVGEFYMTVEGPVATVYYYSAEEPSTEGNYWHYYNDEITVWDTNYSKGLSYTLNASGDSYSVSGIGTCTDTKVVIPAFYQNLPVTKIAYGAFQNNKTMTEVVIPESVIDIDTSAFYNCVTLMRFTVHTNNAAYSSVDGNLYSKDQKALIRYAVGQLTEEYTILDGVEEIYSEAFYNCDTITKITIPASVKSISLDAFTSCDNLTDFIVLDGNTVYKSVDGVLYRGDIKMLVAYPAANDATSFEIPRDVEWINAYAFRNADNLVTITLHDGIKTIDTGAFYDCDGLVSVTIPGSVIEIPSYSFSYSDNLKNVILCNGLEYIGSYAFMDCISIEEIVIPSTVKTISYYAFQSCEKLEVFEFEENSQLEMLGQALGGTMIKTITIPKSVNSLYAIIGWYDFEGVVVEEGNEYYKSIDGNLYSADGKILYMYAQGKDDDCFVIPEGVEVIEAQAFYSSNLSCVVLPSTITTVKRSAFRYCNYLTSIIIPNGITVMENQICYSSYQATIYSYEESKPESWNSSWNNNLPVVWAIKNHGITDDGFVWVQKGDDTMSIIGYLGEENNYLIIPSLINGYQVDTIEAYAFYQKAFGGSMLIPDTIAYIKSKAFATCNVSAYYCEIAAQPDGWIISDWTNSNATVVWGCSNAGVTDDGFDWVKTSDTSVAIIGYRGTLEKVVIPSQINGIAVTTIGQRAFYDKDYILSIEIPETITVIESNAFGGCDYLYEVINHSELTITKGSSSNGYVAYNALVIHSDESVMQETNGFVFMTVNSVNYLVKYIGDDVMVILPDYYNGSQYRIYEEAFYKNHTMKSVLVSDGVTEIGMYAFAFCNNLTEIISIGNNVVTIGYGAFQDCDNLESVYLMAKVANMDGDAFISCDSLSYIDVSDANINFKSIDGNLYNADGTTLILYAIGKTDEHFTIPSSVTTIGCAAFRDCDNLKSITISENVTKIESDAFFDCDNLANVVIPNGVESLGSQVFSGCDSLHTVIVGDGVKTIGSYAFANCEELAVIQLGNNVESLSHGVFSNCASLETITLPNSVNSISFDAFSSCDSLKMIVVPENVTTLGANIFRYCENVVICCKATSQPSTWDSNWNNNGFTVIWGIKSYGITDSGLAWVELDDGSVSIVAYYGDDRMLIIPDEIDGKTVASVESRVFYLLEVNCIIIPGSITTVGSYAFYDYSTVIYCEAESKPEGWHNYWCYTYSPVVWGCNTNN